MNYQEEINKLNSACEELRAEGVFEKAKRLAFPERFDASGQQIVASINSSQVPSVSESQWAILDSRGELLMEGLHVISFKSKKEAEQYLRKLSDFCSRSNLHFNISKYDIIPYEV